jgi:hypothetical protein
VLFEHHRQRLVARLERIAAAPHREVVNGAVWTFDALFRGYADAFRG